MIKRFLEQKRALPALVLLLVLSLMALLAPAMTPYDYKEQVKNSQGEILSHMPPKMPALSFLGIARGHRLLTDRRADYLSDPERYPVGSVIEVRNRRLSEQGAEYCDVLVDYYRYKQLPEETVFLFGTDALGRDLWTRLWRGARVSLVIALFAVVIDLVMGIGYGAVCGYYGGRIDLLLMRICEIIQSIPNVIICSMFILLLGRGIGTMIVAMAVRNWVETAKLSRAQFLRLKNREYVVAARAMGVKDLGLMGRHILPNAMGPLITAAAMAVPGAIFMESFLSFIGLGIPAPEPSVGTLLADAQAVFIQYPYQMLFPAVLIALLMLCFHFVANGLRDASDPKEENK